MRDHIQAATFLADAIEVADGRWATDNEEVLIPVPLRDRVKAAYAALGLDEEQPLEKVALHVYRMPNGTFGINDVVPTETDPAARQQPPGAPMSVEMGQTILIRVNAVGHLACVLTGVRYVIVFFNCVLC